MILLLAAALAAVAALSSTTFQWRTSPRVSVRPLEIRSPYQNTRPEVKYVGDAACARCHEEIAETFRRHPMGRSLSPIATSPVTGGDEAGGRPLFEANGLQYSIERRDGRVIHMETRRDPSGRILARNEAEVQYVFGSGRQGLGYLVERDGFLFQSPISWYVRKQVWDLSPGYEKQNVHFDRPVVPTCLYCHANRVEPVPGMTNRYEPPTFRGHAIGCERCHGPGELHVKRPTVADGQDITIVNPAGLESSLREAVCQQCHLMGHHRVVRLDRREEDFRPGLPFQEFWSVIERPSGPGEPKFVGQVEQMHESRCYRESRGRLGCISCHDPHRLPSPEERVSYYRDRCLECHADRGCSLPARVRLGRSPADDCAGCHMPQLGSSDIVHAASMDHRILRHGHEPDRSTTRPEDPGDGRRTPITFHHELMNKRERAEAGRDIGVALCRDGPPGARIALPLLESALAARPDDMPAWDAKGFALDQLGRTAEALETYRTALIKAPDRESTLIGAAYAAVQTARLDEAIGYWRRAVAISPWRSDYRAMLAHFEFQGRHWGAAAEACRESLHLNPIDIEIRRLLVRCYLRLGDAQAARGEFQTLLGLNPPDRDELLRWFTPLSQPK